MEFQKATQPTMYFIGVTTGKSSIMTVFPDWAKALGLTDTVMRGIDIGIHADPRIYRDTVRFIKKDPLSMGALVTTHKIDLYEAANDLFEYLDPYARRFGELSSISKENGLLRGHAKDPITCGMAMDEFIPDGYWASHPEAGVMIMGAGGSAISMCAYFLRPEFGCNRPSKIVVCNRSQPRLTELRQIVEGLNQSGTFCEFHFTPEPCQNDAVLHNMRAGSLIINATGLGKDRPGSPLTDAAQFPTDAIVWEINYRGDLRFMHQALAQKADRTLQVEDGWMYFIYGWTQVIAEVFHMPIQGELLKSLDLIAAKYNNRA